MKKIISAAIALLIVSVSSLSAQNIQKMYERYSGEKGVSSVYISPVMFKLMKSLPVMEIGDENVQMAELIQSFNGMYILDVENPAISKKMSEEVKSWLDKGTYETLMEAKEEGESVKICIRQEKDMIKEFMLFSQENGESPETALIYISGDIKASDLSKIIQQ